MPTYKKVPAGYRVQVFVKGIRDSCTFPTKREAQLWAAQREIEFRAQVNGTSGEIKTTHDAFTRYSEEIATQHKGERCCDCQACQHGSNGEGFLHHV